MTQSTVSDKTMRGILIASAEKLEQLIANLQEGQILNLQPFLCPWGLRIDVSYTSPVPDKPMVFEYHYAVDDAKFREWLDGNSFLCDSGPLVFNSRGIQVAVPAKDEWNLSMFSVDNEEGKPIPLPLLQTEVVFTLHRDIFNGKEWEVFIEFPEEGGSGTEG